MKLHYGIAVASAKQLNDLPGLEKVDFLELPSFLRDEPDLVIPPVWKKRLLRAGGRREARTLSSLVCAGSGIKLEYFRMFSGCCADFSRWGAKEITLCVDWEAAFSDTDYAVNLREILRCCFGITEKYRLKPVLELRIPGSAVLDPAQFIKFRNSLLIPVRTLVDLHPHEPGALEFLEKFSAAMPFDSSCFRISFDAVGGNYLTVKLLDKICQYIRPAGAETPQICFYPGKNADREAYLLLETVMQ